MFLALLIGLSQVCKRLYAVQIFTSNVSVSRSMQAMATYGSKGLERETAKRPKIA